MAKNNSLDETIDYEHENLVIAAFRDLLKEQITGEIPTDIPRRRSWNNALKSPLKESTGGEAADAVESLIMQGQAAARQRGESLLDLENADEELALARSGAAKVARGERLNKREVIVYEAVISPADRPVLDVVNDSFGATPENWNVLENHRDKLGEIFKSVARIELMPDNDGFYAGTGFVVGPDLVMTNRHVAELFARGIGLNATISWSNDVWLDFKRENVKPKSTPAPFIVERVVMIHPYWDIALLKIRGLQDNGLKPLTFAGAYPKSMEEMVAERRPIAVIGYPAVDLSLPLDIQARLFRNVFGVKRLQPGYLRGQQYLTSFGHDIPVIAYDSTTLGGNSGSAVIDLETGLCLGSHFAGQARVNNYANDAPQFYNDVVLREQGLQFDFLPGTSPVEEWIGFASIWRELENAMPERGASLPESAAQAPVTPAAADWYERHSDEEIAVLWQRDSEETERLLREVLVPFEAEEFIAQLRRGVPVAAVESRDLRDERLWPSFWVTPASDQADVVVLHGIMGGHLATNGGFMPRLWLNPGAFIRGDVAEQLMLAEDGSTDYTTGSALRADGILRFSYGSLLRYLRDERFGVINFSYDWRKTLRHSADMLFLQLQQRHMEQPRRKIAVVAHSMGGLVTSLCASRHPELLDIIESCVFLGSPLHGSFAPVQAVLGTYDLLIKLAAICRNDDIDDMRRMSLSLPGLLEMLPDPARFPDAEKLYDQHNWPSDFAPQQRWLDNARDVQQEIWASPLLNGAPNAYSILSKDFGTAASFDLDPLVVGPYSAAGDGTVPIQSAWHPGLPAYHASASHGLLPRDGAVQTAVKGLLLGQGCDLEIFHPDQIATAQPRLETIDTYSPAIAAELAPLEAAVRRTRIETGLWTQDDWDWLTARI